MVHPLIKSYFIEYHGFSEKDFKTKEMKKFSDKDFQIGLTNREIISLKNHKQPLSINDFSSKSNFKAHREAS